MKFFKIKKGFTLIEILVTLGIVAVLSTVTIITLNPVELLAQSKDATRISDMETINNALRILETDVKDANFGTSSVVYISIPDSSETCANITGLPTLASSTYHCAPESTYKNIDGTGWIPTNLQRISFNSPLSKLPVDPINNSGCGLFYAYVPGWEISTALQSTKYRGQVSNYGTSTIFMMGKTPDNMPAELISRACANGLATGPGDSTPPLGESARISADLSTLSMSGPNFPADGQTYGTIYARIYDTDGVEIEGAEVDFMSPFDGVNIGENNPNLTIGAPWAGYAFGSITSIIPYQNLEISARARIGTGAWVNITQKTYVRFDDPPTVQDSSISANPLTAEADGITTISWTLTALNGVTPVENVPTNCDVVPPGDYVEGMTVTGDGVSTDAQGQVTCTIKTTHAGLYTLNFLMGGLSVPGPEIEFTTYTPPSVTISPTLSTIFTYVNQVPADNATGITAYIHIVDTDGNPVDGATVDCSLTGDGNSVTHWGGPNGDYDLHTTNSTGDMYCELKSTVAEVKTFSVVAQKTGYGSPVALDNQPQYTFIAPGTENNSEISFSRYSAPADGYSQIIASTTIRNSENIPVQGIGVQCFASPGDGMRLIGDGATTDANGQAICRFSSTVAEVKYISIKFSGGLAPATCTGDYCWDYQGDLPVEFTDATGWTAATFALSATSSMTGEANPIVGQIEIIGADSLPIVGAQVHCEATPSGYVNISSGGITGADGKFSCSFWTDTPGAYTLQAYSDTNIGATLISETAVEFTGGPDSNLSTVNGTWYSPVADYDSQANINVTIKNSNNEPMEGIYITGTDEVDGQTYYSNQDGNVNYDNPAAGVWMQCGFYPSDSNGGASCAMKTLIPGTHTIRIFVNSQQIGSNLTFYVTPNGGDSMVSVANSTTTITESVRGFPGGIGKLIEYNIKNENGNPVVGATVQVHNPSGNYLTIFNMDDPNPPSYTTDANGDGHIWIGTNNNATVTFNLRVNGTDFDSIEVPF